MSKWLLKSCVLLAATALSTAVSGEAKQDVPGKAVTSASEAVLQLRRKMLDPDFMALTFQSMDRIYETQTVAAPLTYSPLPREERRMDFTFEFEGKTLPADAILNDAYTNALLIAKDGKIVFERYRNFSNEQTRFTSMSMAKSITSILIGIAIDRGAIRSLDDLITDYVPELKGSAYDGVTLRQAIDMKTGVDRRDGDQTIPGSAGAARREQMLIRNERPMVDEAFMVGRNGTPPGTTFEYSTLNTTVLGWVLERATGQGMTDFTSQSLWQPMGAESPAYWMADGPGKTGRPMNGMGFNATLRDYARIGLMMLENGRANGRQIVSEAWVEQSTGGPHPAAMPNGNRGYQHMWWTVPGQPAYYADGLGGQYIYVDPQTDTVIVKLSYVPALPDARNVGEMTSAFMQAASAWKPR